MTSTVKTRMAPSPTGFLHTGTARTALFNYLFAKKNNGSFVLRIEDTDAARSKQEFENDITQNLTWLGIKWDEGVGCGGEYGPYKQSQRTEIYKKYLKKLIKENHVFYCFHSGEELKKEKDEQIRNKRVPKHVCSHKKLVQSEVEKMKKKKKYIIRFNTPDMKITFKDLIRKEVQFNTNLLGDFSIAKNENTPLYNLAAVIDDYEMKISHVIRGEDHLSNTPRQILIQQALSIPRPIYAHIPLILQSDRSKLSKRGDMVSVNSLKARGYIPEAIINFIAFLGWNPGTEKEIYSLTELENEFDIAKVQKSGAIFNIDKLNWFNGYYIRNMPINKLAKKCVPFLVDAGLIAGKGNRYETIDGKTISIDKLEQIVSIFKERLVTLSEIGELARFIFIKELDYDKGLLRWKKMKDAEIKENLKLLKETIKKIKKFNKKNIEEKIMPLTEQFGRGELLWPLRAALSGQKASPGPFEIAEALGSSKTLSRIEHALNKLK